MIKADKEKCLNCGHKQMVSKGNTYEDDLGKFTVCEKCGSSYDFDKGLNKKVLLMSGRRIMDVDASLYEFLKENETGLVEEDYGIVLYVHIPFYRLDEFVDLIGAHHFEEGGADVLMFNDTVCFEINDVIEGLGHKMTSYKNCFDASEFERYEERLREIEESRGN